MRTGANALKSSLGFPQTLVPEAAARQIENLYRTSIEMMSSSKLLRHGPVASSTVDDLREIMPLPLS
jgi:hypothetical protein